ncbi:hypothetical protein [Desulfosporosinus sp. Sb-LF]|uniref:hypothetical protein n=1 Tax=Desulfosporosinus sp. Sb-LF TaxID=2560027 RepID=UPI00107F7DA5|nr:hypothetical protein [Desulfosporosinus sp. Sb-LF]TGE33380.1 hypothetical protein E4K68_07755 [Desulfosporosinus sp. Sb-LF]
MRRIETSNKLLKALNQYLPPLLSRCPSPEQQRLIYEKYYPLILQHVRKLYSQSLNPFYLCPESILVWLIIPPHNAIGISLLGLRKIAIYWRQQIEPNETIFLLFKIIDLHVPFPVMLFIMFASIGLIITDGANRLVKAAQMQSEEILGDIKETLNKLSDVTEDFQQSIETLKTLKNTQRARQLLDPFNITPRMSVFFPIYDNHTTLGILLIDFRHLEVTLKQSLEPNETIVGLIRSVDIYSPFPLPIMVMLLSMGLFLVSKIQELNQATREEVLSDVKRSIP